MLRDPRRRLSPIRYRDDGTRAKINRGRRPRALTPIAATGLRLSGLFLRLFGRFAVGLQLGLVGLDLLLVRRDGLLIARLAVGLELLLVLLDLRLVGLDLVRRRGGRLRDRR